MKQICQGLFCGDTTDACSIDSLVANHIKLIVVAARDHPLCFEGHFEYAYIPLVDDETDNVLLYIEEACLKVRACVDSNENALVHCVQGVSRSVAVITGFLMKQQRIAFDQSYDIVRSQYSQAIIADNFAEQLRAYGSLYNWDMNLNTQAHRQYRTKHRVPRIGDAEVLETPSFRYICRKCRESLFLDTQCVLDPSGNHRVDCMEWMSEQIDATTSGPIVCPRCATKIGQFSWSGLAGDFDIPGFMITGSKVDKMPIACGFKGEAFPHTRF